MTTVLVLAGGPDAEHEVSLDSSEAIASALRDSGRFEVVRHVIEKSDAEGFAEVLDKLPGGVVFPALHGLWGEGGPLQALLETDGRPYVGSGPAASRLSMDKVITKLAAAQLGIPTPLAAILGPVADDPPIPLPVVLKPTHEGSSVGLYLCYTDEQWIAARDTAMADSRANGRAYLVERMVGETDGGGVRELTVPLIGALDGSGGMVPLPVIEITPAEGTYDYAAKYTRGDTRYCVEPDLADELTARLQRDAAALAEHLGVRHLARVDFMLPVKGDGIPQLLEINTMPGFTSTSLLPKAAAHTGMGFSALCDHLVSLALHHEND